MSVLEKYYYQIKYLLLEFKNTISLDDKYLHIYLKECSDDLKLNQSNLHNADINIDENDEIKIDKQIPNDICKKMYKDLAKIYHPDKNINKNENKNKNDEFVEISKAYEKNDIVSLFLFHYENNLIKSIDEEFIDYLEYSIEEKKNEINIMQNKMHWHWVKANSDIERTIIKEYIKNNL